MEESRRKRRLKDDEWVGVDGDKKGRDNTKRNVRDVIKRRE